MRRCVVSRETLPKTALVRFVIDPNGIVTPDINEKLPGRGIWVKADAEHIDRATSKNIFSRAARHSVVAPALLTKMVENQLVEKSIVQIALARKAGLSVSGFENVRSELDLGKAGVLIQANDSSLRQSAKLRQGIRFKPSLHKCLTRCELGVAFGRKTVVYAAIRSGRLATCVEQVLCRLSGIRKTCQHETRLNLEPAML